MPSQVWTGTYSFPDPQVSALPESWQRLSVLAGGGEGEVYVLWVIPHRHLYFGPDILRKDAHWGFITRIHSDATFFIVIIQSWIIIISGLQYKTARKLPHFLPEQEYYNNSYILFAFKWVQILHWVEISWEAVLSLLVLLCDFCVVSSMKMFFFFTIKPDDCIVIL